MEKPRNIFSDGFIRLSQPSVLNDPFEATFCSRSLDELANHFDDTTAIDLELGEISFSEYIKIRMQSVGVISFSENKENLLMWAHYADEHKGLVIGILDIPENGSIFHNLVNVDLLNSTSFDSYSPFDGKPRAINYRKGLRYRNDKFDYDYSNISAEGADRILYEVFMQKSDEWIYEQEHRIILKVVQADKVILPSLDDITNVKIQNMILESTHSSIDPETGHHVVNLVDFRDQRERRVIANELSKLSKNPNVIYLMKLSSSAINSCLLGLKSPITKSEVLGKHVLAAGSFAVWEAKKDVDYYTLEFKEIID